MANKPADYVWIVAYIDRDHLETVENDLIKWGFSAVRVFIPTVRVLKKQFKNKNHYEYVPLLFNYGFFNIPYDSACDPDFLKKLKEKIPVIYNWVKDPVKALKTPPRLRMDNKGKVPKIEEEEERLDEDGNKILPEELKGVPKSTEVAIVTEDEIASLLKVSEKLSVFSEGIADKLEVGSFITLKGYPYEGMPAEVVKIDRNKRTVKVRLLLECVITEATVHFENIFYTVYSDYSKPMREQSLDELDSFSNRKLDKLYANISYE